MNNRQQPNVNHQDHPHQEGQQNNTATTGNEAQNHRNNNQPMSNTLQEPETQSGDAPGQQSDDEVQRQARTS